MEKDMRRFKQSLEEDIRLEQWVLMKAREEIKTLPDSWLKLGNNGKNVYVNENTALSVTSRQAQNIARRKLLSRKIKVIESNLKLQRKLLEKYQSYREDALTDSLRPVYRLVLRRMWQERRRQLEEQKKASAANGPQYHPENLKHENLKGEVLRSKSEIILTMLYDNYQIPYSYEEKIYWPSDAPPEAWAIKEALEIRDYYIPDFTFTMPDGSRKYHEHLGMMKSAEYMETWKKKMILYFWAGVTPGHNLIVTTDDRHGTINQKEIIQIIESQLAELIGTANQPL